MIPEALRDIPGITELNQQWGYIYFLVDDDEVVYVGQTTQSLFKRIDQHRTTKYFDRIYSITVLRSELNTVETHWIRTIKPKYNKTFSGPTHKYRIKTLEEANRETILRLHKINPKKVEQPKHIPVLSESFKKRIPPGPEPPYKPIPAPIRLDAVLKSESPERKPFDVGKHTEAFGSRKVKNSGGLRYSPIPKWAMD